MKIEKDEMINDRLFDFKVICNNSLFAAILEKNPKSSSVKLTDDELDELLYSVFISLQHDYHNNLVHHQYLSLKNFPDVMRLLFNTINPQDPNIQLFFEEGKDLYIAACRNEKALKNPWKATWITTKKEVIYPEYSEIRKSTTNENTTAGTTPNPTKVNG